MKFKAVTKTKQEVFEKYFEVLNVMRTSINQKPLTNRQIEILSAFASLPPKYKYHRFSTTSKRKVAQILTDSGTKTTLPIITTNLYTSIDEGILRRDEDKVIYFIPVIQKIVSYINQRLEANQPVHILMDLTPTADAEEESDSTNKDEVN